MSNFFDIFGNIILYLSVGSLVSYNLNIKDQYKNFNLPKLSPPSWIFGIVWTLLYILIGIGATYLELDYVLFLNNIQMSLNFSWTVIFFGFKQKLISSLIIFTIICLVIAIIILERPAGYFYIPYLIWICFALYLNIFTVFKKK
jgi:tryptophan-rich sensory protein